MEDDHEVAEICAKLYGGWVEKSEVPQLAEDAEIYGRVTEQLSRMGLELVDRPESPWYVVRLMTEFDSFTVFNRRNRSLRRNHLALLLILYSKLLLPRRTGQVQATADLSVTLREIYSAFGPKFVPNNRKTVSATHLQSLFTALARLGFIVRERGQETYRAGPAMYMLHDELLSDFADTALRTLFGLDQDSDDDGADSIEHEGEQVTVVTP